MPSLREQQESFSFAYQQNQTNQHHFSDNDQEQHQTQQQQILKRMLAMQLQYEKLKHKYQSIQHTKQVKNSKINNNFKINTYQNTNHSKKQNISNNSKKQNILNNSNTNQKDNKNSIDKKPPLNSNNHKKESSIILNRKQQYKNQDSFIYQQSSLGNEQQQYEPNNSDKESFIYHDKSSYEQNIGRNNIQVQHAIINSQQSVKKQQVHKKYSKYQEAKSHKKDEINNQSHESFSYQQSQQSDSRLASYQNSRLESFQFNDDDNKSTNRQEEKQGKQRNAICQLEKQSVKTIKQSILSDSKDSESCEYKNDDSIPIISKRKEFKQTKNNNQKFIYNNGSDDQSFTYKSSTAEDSFKYYPSEKSLLYKKSNKNSSKYQTNKHSQPFSSDNNSSYESYEESFSFQESKIFSLNRSKNQSQNLQSFVYDDKSILQIKQKTLKKDKKQEQSFCFKEQGLSQINYEDINKYQRKNAVQRKNLCLSSEGSFELSRQSRGNNNFEYNLREFSFQIPQGILDPFQVNDRIESIQKQENFKKQKPTKAKIQNKGTNIQKAKVKKPKQSLELINQEKVFDGLNESSDQQEDWLRRLINKLGMRKKLSLKEIRALNKEIKQLAEKNAQLIEIFQTGTYELDFVYEGGHLVMDSRMIEKINGWKSRVLITQLSVSNSCDQKMLQNFFKSIDLPNLQQLTIKTKDVVMKENDKLKKIVFEDFSISFLKYNGLSNRLKVLSLRGQTMNLQIARNIIDLNFFNLKSLYLGFQSHLTDQVFDMLTCSKFCNMPNCKIYIANHQGQIDVRFQNFIKKIVFVQLQDEATKISIQQVKYCARKMKINAQIQNEKQNWDQLIGKNLENYFDENLHQNSKNV